MPALGRICFGLGVMLAVLSASAQGARNPAVSYQLVDHGSFGRLIVLVPKGVICTMARSLDSEVIDFDRPVRLQGSMPGHATGIVSIDMAATVLTIRLQPQSLLTATRTGTRLVMDVTLATRPAMVPDVVPKPDTSSADKEKASILPGLPSPLVAVVDRPQPSGQAGGQAAGSRQPTSAMHDRAAEPAPAAGADLQRAAGDVHTGPVSVSASITSSVTAHDNHLMLPFDRHVGAAAFRRNNRLTVVFDTSQPVDLAPVVADPVFGQASFSLLPSGAVLTMPIKPAQQADLLRTPAGWVVAMVDTVKPGTPIDALATSGVVTLPVVEPGHVVVVPDPDLGTDLLVGTTRQGGQAMPLARHGSDYALQTTLLGVAVERLSDRIELRPTSSGFVLGSSRSDDRPGSGSVVARTALSRTLDLPAVGVAELQRRYKTALAAAAELPAADRRLARLDAAEAALALGRGREAGELAAIADQDAPAGPDGARSAFLRAAASVLAHDPDTDSRLSDPRIGNTDEVALWRALDLVQRHVDTAETAAAIAQRLPLLQAYPDRLRRQLLGPAALTLVSRGDQPQAALVNHLDGDGQVRLAQALLEKRDDHPSQALKRLEPLMADPDPAVAERAVEEASTLQLGLGQIGPGQAADRLEAQILNARMAGDEASLRFQIVALRARQKNWAAALSGLRELSVICPEASGQVRQAVAAILEKIVSPAPQTSDSASPVDPVAQLTLIENNLDLLPAGADSTKISIALATRLSELDLPDRAAALMQKAVAQTSPGADRARLGLTLARLRLDQNDNAGATAALDATEALDLAQDLTSERMLLRARTMAATKDVDGALRVLAPLHGREAEELRAEDLAAKKDWLGEESALAALAALELPPTGRLSRTGEDLVLRLVGAAVHVGDQDALHRLAATWAPRFQSADNLNMLRLLTASSVASVNDLPRSAADLTATQTALSAMTTASSKAH